MQFASLRVSPPFEGDPEKLSARGTRGKLVRHASLHTQNGYCTDICYLNSYFISFPFPFHVQKTQSRRGSGNIKLWEVIDLAAQEKGTSGQNISLQSHCCYKKHPDGHDCAFLSPLCDKTLFRTSDRQTA